MHLQRRYGHLVQTHKEFFSFRNRPNAADLKSAQTLALRGPPSLRHVTKSCTSGATARLRLEDLSLSARKHTRASNHAHAHLGSESRRQGLHLCPTYIRELQRHPLSPPVGT